MAIDKYIMVTMPSSIKRQWAALGGSVAKGVPENDVIYFEGRDARDYGSNLSYVAQAAAEDGYPFLEQFAVGLKSEYIQQSAGNVALFWNWARVLKRIAESAETCMVIWDDRIPNVEYRHLKKLCRQMKARGNFYIAQLRLRADWAALHALGRPEYKFENVYADSQVFENSIDSFHGNYIDAYFQPGLLGYDETMILSPAGASWLLNQMLTMKVIDVRGFVFKETAEKAIYETDPQPQERARLNNDNYLCWDPQLKEAVKIALSNKRGIYTPKRIGYAFVQEHLNFDSDVNWSPTGEGSPKYPTRIRFIDEVESSWE